MTPSDLATMSLLDPEQGVCPAGHPCRFGEAVGRRRCRSCGYVGLALICWDITPEAIDAAERAGAAPDIVAWARAFLADR